MALEYSLELEGDPAEWSLIRSALYGCKVRDVEFVGDIPVSGFFDRTGIYFHVVDRGSLKEVSAEEFPKNIFLSRYVMVFRLGINNWERSGHDLHEFLSILVSLSARRFVLSHQFEEIHAYRTDRFVWNWE